MRRIVCDTGPILHLLEIGALDLLSQSGEVLIPPAVENELASLATDWSARRPAWLRIELLDDQSATETTAWQASGLLHAGEAESLELARLLESNWYLTDDAAARVLASSLGIETHGTIGIVLWAAATEKLTRPETEALLDKLAKSTLWLSPQVIEEARSALASIFPG